MSGAKMTERRIKLRKSLFPGLKDSDFWNRKQSDGFTTIPRTLPLILQIIDGMSKNLPASSTYMDLWCRSFDDYLIELNAPLEMAVSAGFSGQRGLQTWRKRIQVLGKLGFIRACDGPFGSYSYAALLNPYKVIKALKGKKDALLSDALYKALLARVAEIGASDLD